MHETEIVVCLYFPFFVISRRACAVQGISRLLRQLDGTKEMLHWIRHEKKTEVWLFG